MSFFVKHIVSLFVGLMLFFSAGSLQAAQSSDSAVVIVNGVPITVREVKEHKALIKQYQPKANTASEDMILKELITEELVLQVAQQNGIDCASKEVNQAIEHALQSGEIPPALAKNKEKLKRQLIASNFQQNMMMSMMSPVSEIEIKEQMQTLPGQMQQEFPIQFNLETLIIPIKQPDSVSSLARWKLFGLCKLWSSKKSVSSSANSVDLTERAHQIAKEVLTKAKEGTSFKEIALAHKKKPAWKVETISRTPDKLPAAYNDALANLNSGDVAGPFEFYNGLHLIRLQKVSGPRIVRARHILLKLTDVQESEKIKQKLEVIRQSCLSGEKTFAQQAEQYSEDVETVFKGGDLGWILPGTLEKSFDEILETLKPKEISLPFKTSNGWHIAQVVNKELFTPAHTEWKRYVAKRLVEQRKAAEAIESMQKELYRAAHIEWVSPALK